jgi:hypothetical protein
VLESASSERRSGTTLQKAQVKKTQRSADNFPKNFKEFLDVQIFS